RQLAVARPARDRPRSRRLSHLGGPRRAYGAGRGGFNGGGQPVKRPLLEDPAQRNLDPEFGRDPRRQAGAEEGMAAELEEAVLEIDPVDAQEIAPDRRQAPLHLGPRRGADTVLSNLSEGFRQGSRGRSRGDPALPRRRLRGARTRLRSRGDPLLARAPPGRREPAGGGQLLALGGRERRQRREPPARLFDELRQELDEVVAEALDRRAIEQIARVLEAAR